MRIIFLVLFSVKALWLLGASPNTYIEYHVFHGDSISGMPYGYPGLIFRFYEDGRLLFAEDYKGKFNEFMLAPKEYTRLYDRLLKIRAMSFVNYSLKKTEAGTQALFTSEVGTPYGTQHGAFSCVVIKNQEGLIYMIVPFLIRKGSIRKPINRIEKMMKNSEKLSSVLLEGEHEALWCTLEVYYRLWKGE